MQQLVGVLSEYNNNTYIYGLAHLSTIDYIKMRNNIKNFGGFKIVVWCSLFAMLPSK